MWLIGFRDLNWRRRRFIVATLAAALVFAITLVLSGLTASLHAETSSTIKAIGADAWVVPRGMNGAFTNAEASAASPAIEIRSEPGVRSATPLVLAPQSVHVPALTDMNIIGYDPGGFVNRPSPRAGRFAGTVSSSSTTVCTGTSATTCSSGRPTSLSSAPPRACRTSAASAGLHDPSRRAGGAVRRTAVRHRRRHAWCAEVGRPRPHGARQRSRC